MMGLLACVVVSAIGLWIYLRVAPALGLVDAPNARSLHGEPTVVGAGLVVVLTSLAGWLMLPTASLPQPQLLAGLTLLLAVVGLADDRYDLPSGPRLVIYGVVALVAAKVILGSVSSVVVISLVALALLWLLNLFNFMDGADGFAATQSLAMSAGMGLLCAFGPAPEFAPLWWILVACLLPFFWLNWPPARCFMGDAGSIPLGFLLGIAGLATALVAGELGYAWLILMMPFIADATVTLVTRLVAGHLPHQAHSQHAYQRAVRRFGSPLPVSLGLAGMHLVWQFPLAVAAVQLPHLGPILVIFSAIPTLLLLVYLRSAA